MSRLSKMVGKQIKKKGLTALIMYVVRIYVKLTPSKKDDEALEKVETAIRELEGFK
tara:strand:+ start:1968 stop:2135 length:168 start_codon:yes stop_codon:yes gene_type:complete